MLGAQRAVQRTCRSLKIAGRGRSGPPRNSLAVQLERDYQIGGREAGSLCGAAVNKFQLTGIDRDRIAREPLRELRHRQFAIQKNERWVILESVIRSPLHPDKLR